MKGLNPCLWIIRCLKCHVSDNNQSFECVGPGPCMYGCSVTVNSGCGHWKSSAHCVVRAQMEAGLQVLCVHSTVYAFPSVLGGCKTPGRSGSLWTLTPCWTGMYDIIQFPLLQTGSDRDGNIRTSELMGTHLKMLPDSFQFFVTGSCGFRTFWCAAHTRLLIEFYCWTWF